MSTVTTIITWADYTFSHEGRWGHASVRAQIGARIFATVAPLSRKDAEGLKTRFDARALEASSEAMLRGLSASSYWTEDEGGWTGEGVFVPPTLR